MPPIASRIIATPPEVISPSPPSTNSGQPLVINGAPGMSPVLRCPLPILTVPSPDNLRQYYSGGSIPQYRINTPPPISSALSQSGSTTSTTTFSGSLVTTAHTQDTVAIAGAVPNSFVSVSPTNSVAAAMTVVYALVPTSGQVVVYHPATAGGTFNISVTE